jgi:hypothetical protein
MRNFEQVKAEENIMEKDFTVLEVPEWTGSRLTYGAFLLYAEQVVKIVRETGYAALSLEKVGPELEAAANWLAQVLKRSATCDETSAVARADKRRDALWLALWYAWKFTMKLGGGDPLGEAAAELRSEMLAARGMYAHEMSRQSSEVEALRRRLAKPECEAALRTLGLDVIARAMFAANDEWREASDRRIAELAERNEKQPKGEYAVARKRIVPLLTETIRIVNAVNLITPTEASRRCAASLCGTIADFRLVASRRRKRTNKQAVALAGDGDSQPA